MIKLLILALLCTALCHAEEKEKVVLRVGHFPNITHAQGVIGHQLTRQGKGWFEKRLGPGVEIQWFVYNAGPSALEGILTDTLDMTYVGPSPTINAYVRSEGAEVRILCGACSGGAALVVQPDGRIKNDSDFRGKKIGTPQFGNTQDIAARVWLKSIGLNVTLTGGDAFVIPTRSTDQMILFKRGDLDAVWTIEPWVSIILLNAQGKIYLEEKTLWPQTQGKYVTTHLVSSKKFLETHPELVKKWVAAEVELTDWVKEHPEEAQELVSLEIKKETNIALDRKVLDRAWGNIEFTYDPIRVSLIKYAEDAYQLGFIKQKPDLKDIYHLTFLNEILKEQGKALPSE